MGLDLPIALATVGEISAPLEEDRLLLPAPHGVAGPLVLCVVPCVSLCLRLCVGVCCFGWRCVYIVAFVDGSPGTRISL